MSLSSRRLRMRIYITITNKILPYCKMQYWLLLQFAVKLNKGRWKFIKNKEFIFINIALPLIIGLCIYLLFGSNTYINSLFGISIRFTFGNVLDIFIKSWLCDILWSYSLFNAIWISLFAFKRRTFIASLISFVLVISIESLQYFSVISGTFDILDIFFELTAVGFAVCNIKRRG